MNKSYAGGEIEKKAKEMLGALRAGCPEKVWHDLNVEMEEVHEASGAQWANNLYTPKALVIVLVVVSAASFFLWRFLSNNSDRQTTVVTKPVPTPAPAPKPTPPPPPVKKDTVVVKKDTPVKNTPAPVVNTPAPTPAPTPTVQTKPANNTSNNDQLAQQRAAYYKRRDSIRAVRKRARDSAAAVSMNPRVGFPDTSGHHSSAPKVDSAK
jgi:outer membrane biosynthesis protein TonB